MYRNNYNEKRIQLNIRFTRYENLLDDVKELCRSKNISLTDFVARSLMSSLKNGLYSSSASLGNTNRALESLELEVRRLRNRVEILEARGIVPIEERSDELIIRTASEINADDY